MSATSQDAELLDLLLAEEGVEAGRQLSRLPAGATPALSYAQQRLWFLQQLDPASPAYNITTAVRWRGDLDLPALEGALNDVVARHDALRTVFPADDGRAVATVLPRLALSVAVYDDTVAPARVQAQEVDRIFDLARGPLLRLAMARSGVREHVVVLTMHHIVSDAWSMQIFVRELGHAYGARMAGRPTDWPELPIQYADFAAWQRAWLDAGARAEQLEYWRKQLTGPPTLALPTDRPRPARPDFAGAAHGFTLPPRAVAGVRRLAREEGATVFMVLLAGFQAFLHRLTAQDDLVVGAPVANRSRRELEPLIGFFVNTLVLRADFSARPDFRTLVRQVKRTAIAAYAHQDIPFEDLVQELQPERHLSQHPLFQAMFSVQSADRDSLALPGVELESLAPETRVAKFDLLVAFEEGPAGIAGGIEYRTALFDPATIERWAAHFVELIDDAVDCPERPVRALRLLSSDQTRHLLVDWNETASAYPNRDLAELFTAAAIRAPAAVAVRLGGDVLTYQELDRRANRLAHALGTYGVGPDGCVGVCLERSVELIVALLAVVKAGAAYVALEPDYPAERLRLMIEEVGAPVVVTRERLLPRCAPASAGTVPVALCIDRDADGIAAQPESSPEVPVTLDHLAYVSYTSGSTGRPKGVAVTRRGVVRLVCNADFAAFGPEDVFLQFAPVAFDASTLEVWGPLLNGGQLVVMPAGTPSLEELGRTIRSAGVTTLWLTAGLFQAMVEERLDDLRCVRQLLAGGDVLPMPQVVKISREIPTCRLINGYGPTENTTFTCCHPISAADLAGASVPIGRPIANTRVYVLDETMQPVPIGVPGELFAGGDGLARGYVARPDLTAEKFLPNPFGAGRLYRTGDRVRWRADGAIEFLGRFDHQVKIRGYRIEPGETEAALLSEPGVIAAAVVVREDNGRKRLAGYFVGDMTGESLRARLQARLPDYLVPTAIMRLDAFPLNANGKLDRAALPVPATPDAGRSAPTTEVEKTIAAVWTGVLGLEQVGVADNYFALGGDSIGAIQVASRLKRAGWQVDVRDLFQFPSIAELAPRLKRLGATGIATGAVTGAIPLTPAQAWFLTLPADDRHHFNQAILLRPRHPLETGAVAAAVNALWRQHDALRTVIGADGARILPPDTPAGFEERTVSNDAARLAHTERVQAGFVLAEGPLFAAVLYRLASGDRLLLVAHHLVIDGVSWRILLEDLEIALRQAAEQRPIDLGPRSASIASWADAARARETSAAQHWGADAGAAPAASRAANVFGTARTIATELTAATTRTLLTTAHAAFHTEINDLLLTALLRAWKRLGYGERLTLTLEGHGRDAADGMPAIERTVGWFTCLHPVSLFASTEDPDSQLKEIKERLRAVRGQGVDYSIERYLKKAPALAAIPPPAVSFNYLGQFGEESGGVLAFAEESSGTTIGPRVARAHEFDFTALVVRGRMELSLTYPGESRPATEMERLVAAWREEIEQVVSRCASRPRGEKTPSDFTSPVFERGAYEAMLHARGWSPADVDDVYRLSPMQSGLLFQSLFETGSAVYFVQMAYRLRGRIDLPRLADAWRQVGRRHAILRTNFIHRGLVEPVQIVWRDRTPEIALHDVRDQAAARQQETISTARAADLERGFDLEQGALWRVALWRTAEDAVEVVWSYHHLLLDGWSLGLLQRDLLRAYGAADAERDVWPPSAPYRDYIRWLARRDLTTSRRYWSEYLADYAVPTGLPIRTAPPSGGSPEPRDHAIELDRLFSGRIRELAARLGVTLNTVLQAAWGIVLARYNRTDDALFGAIVSGRPADLPGVEEMVGPFICAVPVRVRTAGVTTVAELLRTLQAAALAGEQHHHLPIADIQALTPLGRELFDHLLVFENYPLDRGLGAAESAWRVEAVEAYDRTHYALDLTVDPGDAIGVKFGYDRRVYDDAQIGRAAAHLRHVLEQMTARADGEIDALRLATPAEIRVVLDEFNATAATPAGATRTTLVALLDAAADRWPERTAVVHGETVLTYRELHGRANRVAAVLRGRGVASDDRVGLLVERSIGMIIGVLGVLKSGAAYVPLDPAYPPERLAFMIEDARPRVILAQAGLPSKLPSRRAAVEIVVLDQIDAADHLIDSGAPLDLAPENLAYVIYTSGSTGRPKGVMVEHRSLVNAAYAWRAGYGLESMEVRLLQLASLSFDVFMGDFIRALTNGGELVVCDADVRLDPPALADLLARHHITLFESTPGLVLPLMEHVRARRLRLPDLRLLIIGSDTLPWREYRSLVADFGATMRIVNSYGVTEATIDTCFFESERAQLEAGGFRDGSTPIGRPMLNQRLYVLDSRGEPCPVGVVGELFIGGEGLARGYWGRPELTAERFLERDLGGRRQRLYRTGDLACWRQEGNLEFLGRGDQQVKVRGFRVEPGEIEARLRTHPAVRDVVVTPCSVGGATELVAYVVPAGAWTPLEWRAHLLAELPEHMAPAYWVRLDQLPLSPNGKVDRRGLPAPGEEAGVRSTPFSGPRNPTEEKLAAIWREVLQIERIGIDDNFFELGGHSLKAMQVATRIELAFGVRPNLREFFAAPTIAALGRRLAAGAEPPRRDDDGPIRRAVEQPDYELSYAQQRLWLAHHLGGQSAYNMPESYVLESEVDADALEAAFQQLVRRHEALRTAFITVDGEPRQRILPNATMRLARIDLSGEPDPETRARELADRDAAEPFDLARPPLLRATLLKLRPGRTVFLFTMHHIVGDGWSGNVLYRELFALYAATRRGEPNPLAPLAIHYKDFAVWQKRRDLSADEAYWLQQLAGPPDLLALPRDLVATEERDFRGDAVSGVIAAPVAERLRQLARARRTTLANVVLAVFEALLFQLTRQGDICLGVSVASRNRVELENLIGFFVNLLPVRIRVTAATEFDDLLRQVVTAVEEGIEHQDYPFDLLVQKLNPDRANNRQPLLNVVYAFQNFADVHISVDGAVSTRSGATDELMPARVFERAFKTSKFDLTLFVSDDGGPLGVTLEYDTGLFRAATARKWIEHLQRFAAAVATAAPTTS